MMRIAIIIFFIASCCAPNCLGQIENRDRTVLHFYREKDYGMLNHYAKIFVNNKLKLGLPVNSHDTLHIHSSSLTIKIKKHSFEIDSIRKRNYYFNVLYKPSIFIIAGKFIFVQVEEEYFIKKINTQKFREGLRPK